jgi:hypothetical protein
MTVPIDAPEDAARTGRGGLDPYVRLRLVADGYGLAPGRSARVDALARNVATGGAFLQRRIDRGEESFAAMRDEMGAWSATTVAGIGLEPIGTAFSNRWADVSRRG